MSDKLLEALGAKDENDALRIIAELNQFVGDMQQATGREKFAAMRSCAISAVEFKNQIEHETEKPQAEAIGVVKAWKANSARLEKAESDLAEVAEKLRAQEVEDLLKQGITEGRLTKAEADKWRENDPSTNRPYHAVTLKAHLSVAARRIPAEVKEATREQRVAAANADGKRYEDMTPSDRASLKREDPDLYKALRDDWVKRGKPGAEKK